MPHGSRPVRSHPATLLLLLLLPAIALAVPLQAQVISTFDADLESWLIVGDNGAVWSAGGGNPGGCLDVNDLATGQLNLAAAPHEFLGDWSAMDGTDTLSVDVFFVNTSGQALITGDWLFQISGPGGSAIALAPFPAPAQGVWLQESVSLDAADWQVESGTWEALTAQVTALKILVEYVDGGEEVQIDNVRLSATPAVVFDPCASSDFNATSTDDWSFESLTASNPGAGGTSGGYLLLSSSSTSPYALAPSRFLGDWSSLDGNGYITLDLRAVSGSTPVGSSEFIRLSGPGGSAYVTLADSLVPPAPLYWKRLTFPLEESSWTVDSGTWAGLLAEVSEWRIHANLHAAGEQLGLDNVGRLQSDCSPIDVPVTLYDPNMNLCGFHGFVGPAGLALNPADGVLHVLARLTSADGVYRLTGPDAGVRLRTFDRPAGLIFDEDGDGFVSEDFGGSIFRFVGAESSMVWVSGLHSGDDDPYGMAFAPPGFSGANVSPGDLLVADRGNSGADEVWAFSPDSAEGERLVVPDPGNVDWFDVASSPDGRVWMIDAFVGTSIDLVAADGTLTPLPLSGSVGAPLGIAWDSVDEVLYLACRSPVAVYRVDPDDGTITLIADGFANVENTGIEVDAQARRLWVTDLGANRVYEFCLPGAVTAVGSPARGNRLALRSAPNPFSASALISFAMPTAGPVRVDVYDVAGRRVTQLLRAVREPGEHSLEWDGHNEAGQRVAQGVYIVRVQAGDEVAAHRVAVMR